MNKITAIIPAAGSGKRFSAKKNKLFCEISKIPILIMTLRTICECDKINNVIIVSNSSDIKKVQQLIKRNKLKKEIKIILGGGSRQESVFLGLKEIPPYPPLIKEGLRGDLPPLEKGGLRGDFLVLIHDGDRPLVSKKLIEKAITAGIKFGAVSCGIKVQDTIKEIKDGYIGKTFDREKLVVIQTPQVFKYEIIFSAHQKAKKEGFVSTDDSSLVERSGHPVKLIEGEKTNIKITTKEDLILANFIYRCAST